MSKIVKTITGLALPFVLIFGLYVIAHGHLTPGGGFQGGAVVASGLAMIIVAYGSAWTMKKVKEKHLSILESLGAIGFIGLGFFGLVFGANYFFNNFLANSDYIFGTTVNYGQTAANITTAGVLPLMNFAVGLKVIAGLFAIVLVMAYAISSKEGLEE
jgi:multicomponent Na+:H+ antiporter subunit B